MDSHLVTYFFLLLLAASALTKEVTRFVKRIYPNTKITPLSFRRTIVTLANEKELHFKEETTEQFLIRLSKYINTSLEVIRIHYNESTGFQNSMAVQSHLEESLLMDEHTTPLKERLANAIETLDESGLFSFETEKR